MSPEKKLTLSEVNSLPYEDFIDIFGNTVEKCPLIAAVVWERRPFRSVNDIQIVFEQTIDEFTRAGPARLLRLIPPLGRAGKLSAESTRERASAGLNRIADNDRKLLSKLNMKYSRCFDFPFIICVRQNRKDTILQSLERRLQNSPEAEAKAGLTELKKICNLRLRDLVKENMQSKL